MKSSKVYQVAVVNVEKVKDLVKKFNNKLRRYGREEVVECKVGEPYLEKFKVLTEDGYHETRYIQVANVEVDDVCVELNAKHAVVAKVTRENTEDGYKTIVKMYNRTVNGHTYSVEDFKEVDALRCDHCNSRRNRKSIYILQSLEDNNLIQVGSTCMQDYTHDQSILARLDFVEMIRLYDIPELDELDRNCFIRSIKEEWIPLNKVLAHTKKAVAVNGFVSEADSRALKQDSTAYTVEQALRTREGKKGYVAISDDELTASAEMLEKIKSCTDSRITRNDFNVKLIDLAQNGYCSIDGLKLSVWLLSLYDKIVMLENKVEETTTNEYYGEVGKRIEHELKAVSNICISSYYGDSYMNKLVDADGRIFVWFTQDKIDTDGEFVKFRFTIKKHEEYSYNRQGELLLEKQTHILRAKRV